MRPGTFLKVAAIVLSLWAMTGAASRAEDVKVTSAIADESVDVGQEVDYTITVNGATSADVPENINVDGLTVTYVGPQVQTQIVFGSGFGNGSHEQQSVTETYSVVPGRAGRFTIPGMVVTVNGQKYTTAPVNLTVGGSAAGDANGRLYWAEFVLPENTAYIGEAIPIEIRLYVDSRVRANLEETPEITAEGFTIQKVGKPDQAEKTINNRDYDVVTYKTAITGATAGTLKLGPVSVQAVAQLPVSGRRRMGGPFDNPMFQDPFFDNAFRQMSPPQQIKITAPPIDLVVKPLPAAGQPRSFAGAVGTFSLSTSVKPATVEAGDPITITAKISGRGDFDRVTAPTFTDATGWRTYPPSAKFEGDDDIGISGSKTFQIAVIPQAKKTESPALEWSYFDPIKEQYVTLTGDPFPIKVEGEPAATATPVLAQQAAPAATPLPPSAPDIAYIRSDSTGWGETFEPLYTNKVFWAAQGAPLLALVGFVGFQTARKRAADEQARKRDQWRREKDTAMAAVQRRDVPETEMLAAATRALRLDAAMQTGRDPDTLDGTEVANARELDATLAERVRRLFDQQGEALYAGSSAARGVASAQSRVNVMETLKGYENAKHA